MAGEDKVGVREPEHLTVPESKIELKDGVCQKGKKQPDLKRKMQVRIVIHTGIS